ncbi:hypothetical protein [Bradyrhizobium japonicum]|uniref:hypothetical protein n=1 Tax=Bradyrhizobium japonicum TaxID=375 RepID=UPI0012BC85BA|nr:hypothetical protein [Bradyrhizobium japonicum]
MMFPVQSAPIGRSILNKSLSSREIGHDPAGSGTADVEAQLDGSIHQQGFFSDLGSHLGSVIDDLVGQIF